MLKPLIILICLLAALPLVGCKKKDAAPPHVTEINMGAPPVILNEKQQEKFNDALAQAGVSDERRAELTSELERQGTKYGFKLSADKQFVEGLPQSGRQGMPIAAVLMEINGSEEASKLEATQAVKAFCEKKAAELKAEQAELKAKQAQLARIDQGEIVAGLQPAGDPVGDWQSIGETREGEKHFLVQHDDAYYKILRLNKETKTLSFQEFKEGKLERNTNLPYEYKTDGGQLTTTSAGGGPGDAYIVMELANFPDRLFVRPMYETVFAFTVYKRVGVAPGAMAPRPVEAAPVK